MDLSRGVGPTVGEGSKLGVKRTLAEGEGEFHSRRAQPVSKIKAEGGGSQLAVRWGGTVTNVERKLTLREDFLGSLQSAVFQVEVVAGGEYSAGDGEKGLGNLLRGKLSDVVEIGAGKKIALGGGGNLGKDGLGAGKVDVFGEERHTAIISDSALINYGTVKAKGIIGYVRIKSMGGLEVLRMMSEREKVVNGGALVADRVDGTIFNISGC